MIRGECQNLSVTQEGVSVASRGMTHECAAGATLHLGGRARFSPHAGGPFANHLPTRSPLSDSIVTETFWHLADREVVALGP